jgi:acetyl esterase/lipase
MKKIGVLFLILLLIGVVSAFNSDDVSDFIFGKKSITGNVVNSNICGSSGVCNDLPYAASPSNGRVLKMNIHLPKNINGPWPVVVFFSPGSWVSGDRSNCYTTGSDFITPLLNRGIAVACVDYSNTNENNNPHFPEQIYEAKAAVRFLRANANNYGLNPDKIGAFGASAGGHQAAMLGTSIGEASLEGGSLGNAGVSSAIQAAVVSSGPTYFYPISQVTDGSQNGALYAYLGVDATKNPALYVTVANTADASLYVNGNEPPFLLQYGGADNLVKPSSGQRLDSALKSKNIDSTLHIYPSWGHGDYLYGAGGFDELGEFFVRTLQPPVAAPPTPVVPVRSCGVEILRDTKFEQGFSVIEGTQSSNVACNIPSSSNPYWTLFELATTTNLCNNINPVQTNPSIIYQSQNGAKQLISDKKGGLRMIIDASKEENHGCGLTSNDPGGADWIHYYLVRSYYDKSVDLGAYESLTYKIRMKLNRADQVYKCSNDDHMSFANIFQLINKYDSSKLFWIETGGCGISDNNNACNPDSEAIVYDHLGVPLYSANLPNVHEGAGWVDYNVDIKAVTTRAFEVYRSSSGISLNPNDYYVSVVIPGMEIWGGYYADLEIANISLVGKSVAACNYLGKPVPGDYDKDGRSNLAVFQGDSTGSKDWYVENLGSFDYGWNGPVPVQGDYDGDNKTDFAVFNKADAKWYIAKSTGGELVTEFGWGATTPIPADYDGDGKYDLAVYYPLESKWYIRKSSDNTMLHDGLQFGWNGPTPVVGGDYDGDN